MIKNLPSSENHSSHYNHMHKMAKQVVKASRHRGSRQVGRKESGRGDTTGNMGNMAALFAHLNVTYGMVVKCHFTDYIKNYQGVFK